MPNPRRALRALLLLTGAGFAAIVFESAQMMQRIPALDLTLPSVASPAASGGPASNERGGYSPIQKRPPSGFAGIRWGAPLLSKQALLKTVLKGCAKLIESDPGELDRLPCAHVHIDTDDIDDFVQTRAVPPRYGAAISSQMLMWSYRRFYDAHLFAYHYTAAELQQIRAGLRRDYGEPDYSSQEKRMDWWRWPSQQIQIVVTFDSALQIVIGKTD